MDIMLDPPHVSKSSYFENPNLMSMQLLVLLSCRRLFGTKVPFSKVFKRWGEGIVQITRSQTLSILLVNHKLDVARSAHHHKVPNLIKPPTRSQL